MSYNINRGYGAGMLGQLPFAGSGKHFVVGDSATANEDMLREVFGYDPDGKLRFFNDIDEAVGACTANAGDMIFVMPGHTETITTAGAIALDVAGISVIGLGNGDDRPTITITSTDNTGSITISAASVALKNIIVIGNDDGLTNAVNVTGDGYDIDIETRDTSSLIEMATAVRLDTANNGKLKLTHRGFTAGNAMTSCVLIDDCDNVSVNVDGYGVVSTAWVNLVDVASTNISVRGRMYTQAITNFTRDVVDTITGSTWDAVVFDASAGVQVSGGSATALAVDDVTAIASDVTTIKEAVTGTDSASNILGANDADNGFSSASVVANVDGSIIERLEDIVVKVTAVDDIIDTEFPIVVTAVGAVADAALADTIEGAAAATQSVLTDVKGVLQRLGADSANNTAATTLVAANEDGSVLERLEQVQEAVNKGTGTALAANKSLVDALGTDGTTVTDAAVSVLGAIGADNNNNAFASTNVVQNDDGSVLERLEGLKQTNILARGTLTTSSATVPADTGKTQEDNYWNGCYLVPVAGTYAFQPRLIVDFANAGGVFTIDPDVPFTTAPGLVDYIIMPGLTMLAPTADSTANSTPAHVVGRKTDAVIADTVEGSAATTQSLHALGKSILQRLGADSANNSAATTLTAANADGSILEREEWIQAQIGALVNTGGTATVGGILGDFANITLVSRLNTIDDFLDTEVAAIKVETDQIGTVVNTGGTATVAGILGDFANITLVSRLNTIDDFLDTEVAAIKTSTDKIDSATLTASPTAGSLARFIASGGTALGTALADSKSLVDALGTNGTTVADSAVSVLGAVGADNANNAFASTNVVANDDGSVLERLEGILEKSTRLAFKSYANLTGYDTAAAFTVTGDVLVRVWGVVGATGITSTSGTTTLQVGTTADPDACLPATTIDNSDFAIGDAWTDNNPEDDASAVAATSQVVIGNGADIVLTRSVDDLTAGTLTLYCEWRPLSGGATVVAA